VSVKKKTAIRGAIACGLLKRQSDGQVRAQQTPGSDSSEKAFGRSMVAVTQTRKDPMQQPVCQAPSQELDAFTFVRSETGEPCSMALEFTGPQLLDTVTDILDGGHQVEFCEPSHE
jgi:hypothetical protein